MEDKVARKKGAVMTEHVHLLMAPDTRELMEKQAANRGLSVSAYVRFLVFKVDREEKGKE